MEYCGSRVCEMEEGEAVKWREAATRRHILHLVTLGAVTVYFK